METHLEKSIREVMNQPQVTGAMCVDSKGLCLIAKGNADPAACGFISEISKYANEIGAKSDEAPVTSLEFGRTQILIKRGDNVTTVIYKDKQK